MLFIWILYIIWKKSPALKKPPSTARSKEYKRKKKKVKKKRRLTNPRDRAKKVRSHDQRSSVCFYAKALPTLVSVQDSEKSANSGKHRVKRSTRRECNGVFGARLRRAKSKINWKIPTRSVESRGNLCLEATDSNEGQRGIEAPTSEMKLNHGYFSGEMKRERERSKWDTSWILGEKQRILRRGKL